MKTPDQRQRKHRPGGKLSTAHRDAPDEPPIHLHWLKARRRQRWKQAWFIIAVVAICSLIFLGVQNIGTVMRAAGYVLSLFAPLVAGLAIALILNVPMRAIEKWCWPKAQKPLLQKCRRPVAFLAALILILGILAGIVWLIIPELIHAMQVVVGIVIDIIREFSTMDRNAISKLPFGEYLLKINWSEILNSLQSWLKNESGNIAYLLLDLVTGLVSGVVDGFIAVVFGIYILFSKEKLKEGTARLLRAWFPPKLSEWTIHAATVAGVNLRNFVSGQTIEAVILGLLCMLGMFAMRLPYAPMIGALVGVTALIPVVGAFVGALVGAFIILTVSPVKALIFLGFIIVLQQLEENLIYPRVMGSRVNLPAIWILAAVTVGGSAAGPIGMLIAVPLASTLFTLIKEATETREQKKKKISSSRE